MNDKLPIVLSGIVVHGHDRGRDLGFPTANIKLDDSITVPKHGIYASTVTIDLQKYKDKEFVACTSIGFVKTFNAKDVTIETYILDFDDDIYGARLELTLIYYLHEMIKFNTIENLIEQIKKDVQKTRKLFTISR